MDAALAVRGTVLLAAAVGKVSGRDAYRVGCAIAGALAPAGPVRPGEAALAVAGGLLTGVLVVMLDELRYLFGASSRT
ncbi:hypothetical protein AB0880_27995 [Micromonospora chersina]|uniref:hypothetical protein n=1 Tax=Micromonospora chersina TaxID=47854 RepID=UPI003451DAA2